MTRNYGYMYVGTDLVPGRTASSYREHRGPVVHAPRRHHYHEDPPWPHRRYGDYAYFEGWGWWPRWFPYWDRRWSDYYWSLYDYYGGDAYPDYATYMADAIFRQYGPQWGLVISGSAWMGADPRGTLQLHGGSAISHGPIVTHGPIARQPVYDDRYRQRYPHPHDHYGDYIIVDNAWWPRWFPYWDPNWVRYWWQLYYAYGGDAYADYAQYARDAYLRSLAAQWGWI